MKRVREGGIERGSYERKREKEKIKESENGAFRMNCGKKGEVQYEIDL